MRRKLVLPAVVLTVAALAIAVRQAASGRIELPPPAKQESKKLQPGPLPVKQVILFNSGVGYFQREGQVSGDSRVDLSFATSDINDLLKSLVLEDQGGGRVSAISYDSHDPVDKILHSFALDLNNNPSFGQILNQARGEKIEVTLRPAGNMPSATVKGTVVGMETRRPAPAATPAPAASPAGAEVDVLNLLGTDGGMQSVVLHQIQSVRFLNRALDSDFRRALDVLARSHDVQKKSVSLRFQGNGSRKVRLGYVVEQPIWKMTYRLRMEPGGKVFLQGWALVDNTTDEDWKDVRLVLVSGRPISYQMNLYEPLYVPRPTVEPALFASLRPPVYAGAIPGQPGQGGEQAGAKKQPGQGGGFNFGGQFGGQAQFGGQFGGQIQGGGQFGGQFGGFQFGGQIGGQMGGLQFGGQFQGNRYQGPMLGSFGYVPLQSKLTYEELQKRRQQLREAAKKAKGIGRAVTGLNFREGIEAVTAAEEIGDYFQYQAKGPISLSRQRSAMIPVLGHSLEGTKVSIFNERVHSRHPLLGLRLKNTSGEPLPQGPITVFDQQNYAGDTRILNVQPDEQRLLSYAMDLGTEVVTTTHQRPGPEMALRISGDGLTARFTLRQTKTYVVANRSRQQRTVIIEHPIHPDWKLVEPTKPAERSRNVYRFEVKAPPGKSARLVVAEEQPRVDPIALITPKEGTPFYAVAEGITVKQVTDTRPPELVGLTINKGVLEAHHRQRTSKTYYVQNLSGEKRTFFVSHLIPAQWQLLRPDGKKQLGPGVFRFKLEAAPKQTVSKEVVQEREVVDKNTAIRKASPELMDRFLTSPAVRKDVKAALAKAKALGNELQEAERKLTEARARLDAVTQDQARVRENLKIIPQKSEPYKKVLEKFVSEETEIDALQGQIRQLEAAAQKQRQEYDTYGTTLSAG